ncbi:MAG: S9 family peptidase, partial [Pseudomonadota bacterium]
MMFKKLVSLFGGAQRGGEQTPSNAGQTAKNRPKRAAKPSFARPGDDPYAWLEAVDSEEALAFVRSQNGRSLETLEADPRFKTLQEEALTILNSSERIADPALAGRSVRNFWQDEAHVRGLWREADLRAYLTGVPKWRTLLDVDALAASENENWVFQGADVLAPELDRAMVSLSRGGADAAVRREFSIREARFIDDGFILPESKGATAWFDPNTLLVGVDFGPG